MGLMLDTSVFVQFERTGQAIDFSRWEDYGDVYISAITASELLVGVHYGKSEARRNKRSAFVEAILARIPILGFDIEEARVHSSLFAKLSKKGQNIGAHDLLIAATALVHDCAVLTGNVSEFKRIPGLKTLACE